MFHRSRERFTGLACIVCWLLQLFCILYSSYVYVHGVRYLVCNKNADLARVREHHVHRNGTCNLPEAFLSRLSYRNYGNSGRCSLTGLGTSAGQSNGRTIPIHSSTDGGVSNTGNTGYSPRRDFNNTKRTGYGAYTEPIYPRNAYENNVVAFQNSYGYGRNASYNNRNYQGKSYQHPMAYPYGANPYSGYNVYAPGNGYVNKQMSAVGGWHATVGGGTFTPPATHVWPNTHAASYHVHYMNSQARINHHPQGARGYLNHAETSVGGGVYGSERLQTSKTEWRHFTVDKSLLTSREYFSSFRPYSDITWFTDHTPDEDWPGADRLKQGETYDGIIRHWLTPLHAVFLTIEKMTECCLVTDDIPLEYTLPSVRANFKVDHVIHAKLKWPKEFDEKGRPKVVVSLDRQYSPFEYVEGDYAWGTPLMVKDNIAILKLDRGDHLALIYLAELGMKLINCSNYKMSQFIEKGERLHLQIARMPSFPRITSYLVRVPWDSPKRTEWAEKFPEIKEAIAPCVYGSYAPAINLLRESEANRYDNNHLHSQEQSYNMTSESETKTMHSILPTAAKPQTIGEFTKKIGGKIKDILRFLFLQTKTPIDPAANLTTNLAKHIYNFVVGRTEFSDIDIYAVEEEINLLKEKSIVKTLERPPIVVLMGHINHGKTSIFDMLTETKNIDREPGNITQVVRAEVLTGDYPMTLIDTPGHEVFDAMRSCGAKIADIALIVVDSLEGLKKQTRESIKLCKNMGIPFIIAATKCDMPNAQHKAEELALQLSEEGVVIEGLGGDIQFLQVSVKQDVDNYKSAILNAIMLQSAVSSEEVVIEAPGVTGRGFVLESGKGTRSAPFCLAILKQGTIGKDGFFVSGKSSVKIKTMKTTSGKRVTTASPSHPVIIEGFEDDILPTPGDNFVIYSDEEHAELLAEHTLQQELENIAETELRRGIYAGMDILEERQTEDTHLKKIPVILKSATRGSVEALKHAISSVSVKGMMNTAIFDIVEASAGPIYKSDVISAKDAKAIILGLDSTLRADAKADAKRHNVTVLASEVIYDLLELSTNALKERLGDKLLTEHLGSARVLKVFNALKGDKAAGCVVTKGKIPKDSSVRVLRQGKPVYSGSLTSLRHTTDSVDQAVESQSCGMVFKGWNDVQVDDIVEAYAS